MHVNLVGKGQPDVATRLFLRKVRDVLQIPVLALVDSDPYGLKILSVYCSGSKQMSYDSNHLTTTDIKWLGVCYCFYLIASSIAAMFMLTEHRHYDSGETVGLRSL